MKEIWQPMPRYNMHVPLSLSIEVNPVLISKDILNNNNICVQM